MTQENSVEISVVLPCLNEELSVGECVRGIREVLSRESLNGEIIVADNGSTDRSAEVALAEGAKVVFEPFKGYGAAYLRGLKEVRGKYIVIADSDLSYDFNDIPKFLKPLREGFDFVLGSRFKGKMKKGAMSWSHRYIGNPILSGICRLFFRTKLTDIHCGMRAFSATAYRRMELVSTGMEFATEMVVAALRNDLKITEVPIDYLPRSGTSKLMPLADAWRHVRFMLLYCPLWLYTVPGLTGLIFGLFILFALLRGPVLFMGRNWDTHLMVFASMISILAYQILHLGIYAHTYAIRQGFIKYDQVTLFFKKRFNLERGIFLGGAFFLAGLAIVAAIFIEWFRGHFGPLSRMRESILAMTLIVIGIQTIFSSFFVSLLFLQHKPGDQQDTQQGC